MKRELEMNTTPKVSVIIPIFNTELYLSQCLTSVCEQTYCNIEIILVNDGSTDKSGDICKEFTEKDDRIIYIEQENRGQGIARNRGIEAATGDYITFIDSDDWVNLQYIRILIDKLERNDNALICRAGVQFYDEKKGEIDTVLEIPNVESNNIYCYTVPQVAGNLYRRTLFRENKIVFPAKTPEDLAIYPVLAMLSEKIEYEAQVLYYYRINRIGSSSSKKSDAYNYPIVLKHLIKEAQRLGIYQDHKCLFMKICLMHMGFFLEQWKATENIDNIVLLFEQFLDEFFQGWRKYYVPGDWILGNRLFLREESRMVSPKVSVIVPVYNAEQYLRQCLESIKWQTLKDIEILCINDGSTDSSLQILNEYAKGDSRFYIINQENGGYGKAMNAGLRKAKGEYIAIIESDDFAEDSMLETLYDLAAIDELDIVKSNYYEYTDSYGSKNTFVEALYGCPYDQIFNPIDNINVFFAAQAIWSALYKRTFLLDNCIYFNETPGASYQDTAFVFKSWVAADKALLTRRAFLHYRVDNLGASVKAEDKVLCVCDEYKEIETYILKFPDRSHILSPLVCALKFRTYSWNYERIHSMHKEWFWEEFRKEFLDAQEKGKIDYRYWQESSIKNLEALLRNEPEKYQYLYYIAEEN